MQVLIYTFFKHYEKNIWSYVRTIVYKEKSRVKEKLGGTVSRAIFPRKRGCIIYNGAV